MNNSDELPDNISPLELSLYLSTLNTPKEQWETSAEETFLKIEEIKKHDPQFQYYLEQLERDSLRSKDSIKNKLFKSLNPSQKLSNQ